MPEDSETEKKTLSQKLTKGLRKNVMATVNLTAAVTQAFKSQGDIAKTFISTGNKNAISVGNLTKTFSTVGLSLNETLSNFKDMQKLGLDMTSKGNRDLFARYTLLGASTQGLSKIMAMNEQTLGFSNQRSEALGDSLLETAAANGFHSDVLVDALNSLAQTFIRASAVYGKETSKALQDATTNLIGRYGAGNADLVKEMTSTLFAGTAKSTKMASMLGIDISKLATQDSAEAQAVIEQAIAAIGNKIGGAAGEGSSGFTVSKLMEVFGATPGMVALANLGPVMGEAAVTSAETLADQKRANDLQGVLNTIMKDFTIGIMPVLGSVSFLLQGMSFILSLGNGFLVKILAGITAGFLLAAPLVAISKANLVWNKLSAISSMGVAGKILAGAMIVGALVGAGVAIASSAKNTGEDILEENKKQTAAITGESATSRILSNISRSMIQSNLFNEQILLNSQEHLEVVVDAANTPVEGTTQVGNLYENPPSQLIK